MSLMLCRCGEVDGSLCCGCGGVGVSLMLCGCGDVGVSLMLCGCGDVDVSCPLLRPRS